MTFQSNHGLYNSGTYLPFVCNITAVTQAQQAVVTTAVNHSFLVGNEVTFQIPKQYGMRQLNGLNGSILSTTTNTITVNIDTTQFDAFSVPSVPATVVLDPAQVLAIGDTNSGYQEIGNVVPIPQTIPGSFYNTYP